jgi:HAMP domain-containing protein
VNAGTWVAIAAALIAAVAVYFNFQSTRAANRAARAADEQTKIQQQLRIEAAQPYVWADVRGDEATGTLLNLVVGNSAGGRQSPGW